jgi:hypothetical protein
MKTERYRRKRVRERKTGKRDQTPSVPPTMTPGAQNMKTGHDALGTAENESGRANHENGSRRPRNRQNESRSAKHENGIRRPRYRRKRVRERKT